MSASTTLPPNHPLTSRHGTPSPHDLAESIRALARTTGRNTRATFGQVIDATLYQLSAQPPQFPDPITQLALDVDYVAESYLRRTIGHIATTFLTRLPHFPGLLQDTHNALDAGDDRPPRQTNGSRTTTPSPRTTERMWNERPGLIAVNPSHAQLVASIRTARGSDPAPSGQTEPTVVVVEESNELHAKLSTIVLPRIQTPVQGVIRVNASADRPPIYEVKTGAGPSIVVHPRPRH